MRYSQTPFDPYCAAHVRHADPCKRSDHRKRRQNARTLRYEDDPPLCADSRFVDPARHANSRQEHGAVKSCRPNAPYEISRDLSGRKGAAAKRVADTVAHRSAASRPRLFTKGIAY